MCHFETSWKQGSLQHPIIDDAVLRLSEMVDDGLLNINDQKLVVTEKGKPFVRNICMAFDAKLIRNKPTTQLFSMTI